MEKQELVGSWEIAGAGDYDPNFDTGRQRIEFFDNGTVAHYWGGTRSETESWKQEAERATGTWRIAGGDVYVDFYYGKEWMKGEGVPMLDMTGKLTADGSRMHVEFKRTDPRLGEGAEEPQTLLKRE